MIRLMSRRLLRPLAAAVATVLIAGASGPVVFAADNTPPEGFTPLFDGKTLDGWWGLGHTNPADLGKLSPEEFKALKEKNQKDVETHWKVEDGAIVNDGHGVYLTTEKQYGDIELRISYKTVAKADSGIYLRTTPQVQIWDWTDSRQFGIGADKGSGGLWNNNPGDPGKDPLVLADKPFGEWNDFRIIQVGARTTVWLNDKLVVDHALMRNYWDRAAPLARTGYIQLQTHGGVISWKNLYIREIGTDEGNKILASHDSREFKSLFDGKTLTGWAGATDNYEVAEGAIRCKPHKGGVLYYNENYSDFKARVEFKLPPGGNNGLAIRYPGTGDTAYSGMTELQVLDNDAPQYAKLDKRQYHGSVYGMIPAYRGYLRKTGEWNFEEVTIVGSTIKVELNGNLILDGDVSKVTEFMANSPHPGKDRTEGFFGFAGHGDAVEFRDVMIKPLTK